MNALALSFIEFYQNFFAVHSSQNKNPINKTILILAPHPDDECLMSSLALRLRLENNCKLIAAAVTLGSNTARQNERANEFRDACQVLGAQAVILHSDWSEKLKELTGLVRERQVDLIIAPHLKDHHPAHIKTGVLARDVMSNTQFDGIFIETEFWGELERPNLLVEVTSDVFTLQFDALTKHVGEVSRNPYHLRLASNLVNNVRRGAEKVRELGSKSPDFAFGNLYQFYVVRGGKLELTEGKISDHESDLAEIFSAAP